MIEQICQTSLGPNNIGGTKFADLCSKVAKGAVPLEEALVIVEGTEAVALYINIEAPRWARSFSSLAMSHS